MIEPTLNEKYGVRCGEVLNCVGDFITVWYTFTPHSRVFHEMDQLGYAFVSAIPNNVPVSSAVTITWKKNNL